MDINSFALGYSAGKKKGGGGAELNIHYGMEPPEDTSKLWVKSEKPDKLVVADYTNIAFRKQPTVAKTSLGNMPYKIYRCVTAVIGETIYIMGGNIYDEDQGKVVGSTKVFSFDIATKQVAELEITLPTEVSTYHGGEQIGNRVYFFKEGYGVFWYNPETGESETIETDYTPAGTYFTTHIGNKIYFVKDPSNNLSVYDLETNVVSFVGVYQNEKASSIIAVGQSVYTFGSSYIQMIDIETGISTIVYSHGSSSNDRTRLVHLGGREIYMFGSYATTILYVFDIYDGTLTRATVSETGRNNMYPGIAVVGDDVYSFGSMDSGYSGTTDSTRFFNYMYKYSFPKGKIKATPGEMVLSSMTSRGFDFSVSAGEAEFSIKLDGCYLGDYDGVGNSVDAYIFNTDRETWELARIRR
jgi:hypothetical protein